MGKESSKNPIFVTAATGLAPNQQSQSEKKAASQEAAFFFKRIRGALRSLQPSRNLQTFEIVKRLLAVVALVQRLAGR